MPQRRPRSWLKIILILMCIVGLFYWWTVSVVRHNEQCSPKYHKNKNKKCKTSKTIAWPSVFNLSHIFYKDDQKKKNRKFRNTKSKNDWPSFQSNYLKLSNYLKDDNGSIAWPSVFYLSLNMFYKDDQKKKNRTFRASKSQNDWPSLQASYLKLLNYLKDDNGSQLITECPIRLSKFLRITNQTQTSINKYFKIEIDKYAQKEPDYLTSVNKQKDAENGELLEKNEHLEQHDHIEILKQNEALNKDSSVDEYDEPGNPNILFQRDELLKQNEPREHKETRETEQSLENNVISPNDEDEHNSSKFKENVEEATITDEEKDQKGDYQEFGGVYMMDTFYKKTHNV